MVLNTGPLDWESSALTTRPFRPDYIPVVVLKTCEPELSYILAKLFFKCLKESCFPDFWKVSLVVPVFKMLEKGLQLKSITLLVFFLWLVKSLKNL